MAAGRDGTGAFRVRDLANAIAEKREVAGGRGAGAGAGNADLIRTRRVSGRN